MRLFCNLGLTTGFFYRSIHTQTGYHFLDYV
nr:MAG TPA: hypothetical protein [Caudoviricetes sp.]